MIRSVICCISESKLFLISTHTFICRLLIFYSSNYLNLHIQSCFVTVYIKSSDLTQAMASVSTLITDVVGGNRLVVIVDYPLPTYIIREYPGRKFIRDPRDRFMLIGLIFCTQYILSIINFI